MATSTYDIGDWFGNPSTNSNSGADAITGAGIGSLAGMIPGIGAGMTAVGLIGGLLNKPDAQKIDYSRPAELENAFATLMSLPGFKESLSSMNRGAVAAAGQARREGTRDLNASLADPGQVARFVRDLTSSTAGMVGSQMGQNYQTAFQGQVSKGGTMGNLSLEEAQLKSQIDMFNAQQSQVGSDYYGNLFSNLGMGGAYMMASAL